MIYFWCFTFSLGFPMSSVFPGQPDIYPGLPALPQPGRAGHDESLSSRFPGMGGTTVSGPGCHGRSLKPSQPPGILMEFPWNLWDSPGILMEFWWNLFRRFPWRGTNLASAGRKRSTTRDGRGEGVLFLMRWFWMPIDCHRFPDMVNCHKKLWKITMFIHFSWEKPLFQWPFSVAILT